FRETSQTWKSIDDIPDTFRSILIGKRRLKNRPLTVVGIVSLNDLREPVLSLFYLSCVFGVIALIIGITSAVFYATRLTGPIRQLTQKVQQISNGERGIDGQIKASEGTVLSNLSTTLSASSSTLEYQEHAQDELSFLNRTFDLMADKLDQDTQRLLKMATVFEKFVPYQFLNRLVSQGLEEVALGKGERDFITIMFSDIRSFTSYSENMEPEELFGFLNDYLKVMNRQIHENFGFIDKFIGDAIMALFDHPDKSDHTEAHYAVKAAIDMQEELKAFNRKRMKEGHREIKAGIGIHSGQAMIGTIGSEKRMDFTVLGDNVNLASRIEGLTKLYGVDIMISDSTLRLLKDLDQFQHRELDWVKVKGKSKPVELYEIYNNDPPEIQELKRKAGSSILRGLTQRRRKAWDKAIAAFEKALAIYPDDQAAKLHIVRCRQLKQMDLPDDWDGSIGLDQK
ncbi:MAG: HAMP domain-containing protein, partial [Proteobacteria bacterium]|nr:HAMP domain-containing protein [Pseudomonadota bacterium]